MTGVINFIATWFGYTGSCVFSPDATCRPFLAFVALGAAATVALVLVVLAYRRAQEREVSETEERRARARTLQTQERIRRAVVPHAIRTTAPLRSDLRAAV
ncbi:MAG TPA: hypothetical protein VED01_15740 [Burkholderiales bacterium]|nr:hypothetical protein [Burkholderiales bacterium]